MARANADGVTLRARDGVAGFAGLQHCGSVWVCPCCGGKILTHRALEIGSVLSEAVSQGYQLGFFTLTMRHNRSQGLQMLWKAGQAGWQRAISGKAWRDQSAGVVEGWVRVWEVSTGRNGWHVHVHGVMVLAPGAGAGASLNKVATGMFRRWSKGLVASGLEAPLLVGQEWHVVRGDEASDELAGYLFKVAEGGMDAATGLGLELTHSQPGRSRVALATRPVASLLEEFNATGDLDALDQWHELERVSKGKRQVGFSKGLRDRFAPAVEELTDEQVAELEHGSKEDDLVRWDLDGWRQVVRDPTLPPLLLEAAESGGVEAVCALLGDRGIRFERVRESDG